MARYQDVFAKSLRAQQKATEILDKSPIVDSHTHVSFGLIQLKYVLPL